PAAFDARTATRALATVVAIDRTRVERRRLVREWGRICHDASLIGNIPPTMVVEAQRLAVESVARAAAEVAASSDLRTALGAIARAAATATGADLSVVRVADAEGVLVARAQAPEGSALAAEVAGTRASCEQLGAGAVPEPTLRAARRAHAAGILALPARAAGRIVGSIELVRIAEDFDDEERAIADLIAAQVALAFRTIGPDP